MKVYTVKVWNEKVGSPDDKWTRIGSSGSISYTVVTSNKKRIMTWVR